MDYAGTVSELQPQQIATIATTEAGGFIMVGVTVGATELIKFPVPPGTDSNEIATRVSNVVNQTGLVTGPVVVEVTEVP